MRRAGGGKHSEAVRLRSFLVTAAALALAASACGGSGEESERAERVDRPPAQRDEPEPISLEEEPATPEEVRWVGRLIDWAVVMAVPIETAVTVSAETEGAEPTSEERVQLEEALAAISACEATFQERVGDPPSERLEVIESNVRGACELFEAGARAGERLLVGDGDEAELGAEWKEDWATASDLMTSVAEAIGDFQPGNARDLPVATGVRERSRVEPTFSRVAESLVDEEVEVRCWSREDWEPLVREAERFSNGRIPVETRGFITGFHDHRVNLHPEICESLVALSYQGVRPRGGETELALALAVGTLAHEAQHVRGVANEALAECWGMQMIREAAAELGAEPGDAARLAQAYGRDIYPLLPQAYRSPECSDGGRLDTDPDSPAWP